MALDVDALRENFNLVVERSPTVTRRFYEILFERCPESQQLFGRNSSERQEKMLAEALVAVLDHLEDAPWLHDTLFALGAKHVGYGVTEEMYGWVGSSLLETLAEISGDAWTPRVEDAWTEAYGIISRTMLEGASSVARQSSPDLPATPVRRSA
jgi:hemoglobin-like flavoprotein